jgi:serine/threonine-protein phosphatase 2B regulatory subunit
MRLDQQGKGWVSVDDVLTLSEFQRHPLRDRIVRLLTNQTGEVIDFKLFAQALSFFSGRSDPNGKTQFFFKVYDMDGDGFIGEHELFVILRMLVSGSLSDEQVQSIVDQVITLADKDKDGKLSYREFCDILGDKQTSSILPM